MKNGKSRVSFIPAPSGKEIEVFNKLAKGEYKKIPEDFINNLKEDKYEINIFISPDCTYCPKVVYEFGSLALLAPKTKIIIVNVYDVMEESNYETVEKHEITSVPTIFANGKKINSIKELK